MKMRFKGRGYNELKLKIVQLYQMNDLYYNEDRCLFGSVAAVRFFISATILALDF